MKKLYRSNRDKMVAGVCGGIAEYFHVDSSLVRLLWVLMVVLGGTGVLLYIIGWIIIPEREDSETVESPVISPEGQTKTSSNLFGVLLIGVGIMLLLDTMVPWRSLARFWPVVLIIAGLLMIVSWRGDRS